MRTPKQIWNSSTPQRKSQVKWGTSLVAIVLILASLFKLKSPPIPVLLKVTVTISGTTLTPKGATSTPVPTTPTNTPVSTDTPVVTDTSIPTDTAGPTPTDTSVPPPTPTSGATFTPFPNAPLCLDVGEFHDNTKFHTLWDAVNGCHYDHEHGENAFTQEVADAFLGFDLQTLMGGVQIGHTNPSSPLENTAKHGGFKWQVQTQTPHGCNNIGPDGPFEGATYGVDAAVIQYHNFGDYSIEFNARIHSASELIRVCSISNPSDKGYMYVVQFEDYGQRVVPYQGMIAPYPDTPFPSYTSSLGPYFTVDCVNGNVPQCRASRQYTIDHNFNTNSIWTSKPTGFNSGFPGDKLFKLLFRIRDIYRLFDWNDQEYPFTFVWMCSSDGGVTYNPAGCRYNNSTTRVHEIAGTVPSEWDNLSGFDTNPTVGRITAEGFVSRFGDLRPAGVCLQPGVECFPIKMIDMFVGTYGDELAAEKISNPTIASNPERDIYFCAQLVCAEGDTGAVPSGWISSQN